MTGSVTFSTSVGGDGSTVTDDDNATTGLRNGGWRTRFVPCFTNQVAVASFVVTQATNAASSASSASTSATNAATSASSASTYASNASSSASSASTSATNAATSASAAASSAATVAASFSSPPAFGNTTPNTGAFTTLSASSTVSGTGFSNYLASPPAIGGTAAAAGSFTALSASSTVSGTGFSNYLASPPAIGSTAASTGAFTTLSASSTVTFSGGTANGVLYLNGSKVATSGSALTFDGTNLVAVGSVKAGNGNTSLEYSSGIGYLWTYAGTGLSFGVNSSEQMRLTSTGLGIGTSSPSFKLDVTGIARVVGGSASSATFGANQYIRLDTNANGGYTIGAPSAGGISTGYYFTSGATSYAGGLEYQNTTNTLTIRTNNTTQATVDSSGNLGLGVTPSGWQSFKAIDIGGGAAIATYTTTGNNVGLFSNCYYNGTNYIYKASTYAQYYSLGITGQHQWFNAPSGTAGNPITFTQAMTLDVSGNLLVGMTSVAANANGIVFEAQYGLGRYSHASGTASGQYYSLFLYNNTAIGSITQNGTTGVLYNITSDQRLKTNIVSAPDSSQIIDSIQVRSFDWLADGSHQRYGMIAQELLDVAPEAVSVPADEEEMMGVDYSKLVPMLIKEIQSLRTRVANLER